MPSPFPGMDPWLEGARWPGLHSELIVEIRRQLVPQLQPRYHPFIDQYQTRTLVSDLDIKIGPDVAISTVSSKPMRPRSVGANAAEAKKRGPIAMTNSLTERTRQARILIRDMERRRLVTVIEILSPANKNQPGREKYLQKWERILDNSVNLVELDLLRLGQRIPMLEPYPEGFYFILVSRARKRPHSEVWAIDLDDSLPDVPIPLLRQDAASVRLQYALDQCYELGGYQQIMNDRAELRPSLSSEWAAWCGERLRTAGKLDLILENASRA